MNVAKRIIDPKKEQSVALSAIKKKLIGKKLSYPEIFAVMDQIAHERLGTVLTTYFAAAGFKEGFTNEELYFLTKAMVETGEHLHFPGIVADKHSIGGVAGTRTTMILVPIIAAAGFTIPKNSSRAITSPAGTADTMEVLAPVTFTVADIKRFVAEVGGCIVWGGQLALAPADDVIIQVEQPLGFESYDKFIVSIMAKKIASGATHLVLDIPIGPNMKVQHEKDAQLIAHKFTYIAEKFKMKIAPDINFIRQNAGRGIGPLLEARDVLMVLEQHKHRPLPLEEKAVRLAGKLLDLCFADKKGVKESRRGKDIALDLLQSGKALAKMREIIKIQGGDPDIASSDLAAGQAKYSVRAPQKSVVKAINNHHISTICKVLGCPKDKRSGIYLNTKVDETVDKGAILCTLYSSDSWRLKEAVETLKHVSLYTLTS